MQYIQLLYDLETLNEVFRKFLQCLKMSVNWLRVKKKEEYKEEISHSPAVEKSTTTSHPHLS